MTHLRRIVAALLGLAIFSGDRGLAQGVSPTPASRITVGADPIVGDMEAKPTPAPGAFDAGLGLDGAEIDMRKPTSDADAPPMPADAVGGEFDDLFRFEEIRLDLKDGAEPVSSAEARAESERAMRSEIPDALPSDSQVRTETRAIERGLSDRQISLLDALRITLLQDPEIRLRQEDVAAAKAAVLVARGQFDFRIAAATGFARDQTELSARNIAQQQNQVARNKLLIKAAGQEAEQVREEIELLQSGGRPESNTLQGELQNQFDAATLEILESLITPDQIATIRGIQAQQRELEIETRQDVLRTLDRTADNAKDQLRRFPVNSVLNSELITHELALLKQFRNGISVSPFLSVARSTDNFSSRSGIEPITESEVGISLDIPLARGLGSSAAATERATMIDYEASLLSLRHITSQRVLNTVLAYWNLVAAQERLALFVRSELISGTLTTLGRTLVESDAIPAADMAQIEANDYSTASNRIAAELAVITAAQALGEAMGLRAGEIAEAPIAADPFPASITLNAMRAQPRQLYISEALRRRSDRQASMKLQQSGKVLADAARFDLRPRIDAQLRVGYTGRIEDSSGDAFTNAFTRGQAGPSLFVGLSMDWPLENNAAEGAYDFTTALYRKRVIQTENLSRSIVSSVYLDLKTMELSIRRIDAAANAVKSVSTALETEREKFKLGDATVLDAIQTEDRLTAARLSLVAARLSYAQALALLRFETGTIMPGADGEASVGVRDLFTLPTFEAATTR